MDVKYYGSGVATVEDILTVRRECEEDSGEVMVEGTRMAMAVHGVDFDAMMVVVEMERRGRYTVDYSDAVKSSYGVTDLK